VAALLGAAGERHQHAKCFEHPIGSQRYFGQGHQGGHRQHAAVMDLAADRDRGNETSLAVVLEIGQ
jgi:hypothetical protein